jgi:riboflavin synthase
MFTGLVRSVGTILAAEDAPAARRLRIAAPLDARDLALGASVAVNGVCLTVTATDGEAFFADAAFETLRKTTLGRLKVGSPVNLEPSLRVGDALGGHLVSGHVDGVGALVSREPRGDAVEMWFSVPPALSRFIAVKGSIAVDGTSLTVNEVRGDTIAVGLVPHTLRHTNLGTLQPGDPVNLEVDQVARYVGRLAEFAGAGTPTTDGTPGDWGHQGQLGQLGQTGPQESTP